MTDFYCGTDQDLTFRNGAGSIWTGGLSVTSLTGTGSDATINFYRGDGKSNPFDLGTSSWKVASDDSSANNMYFYGDIDDVTVLSLEQDTNTAHADFVDSSDVAKKDNIETISDGLDIVNALNPVKFDWKKTGLKSQGFVAQEVESVLPHCVVGEDYIEGEKGTGKAIKTAGIVASAVKAIQELSAKVDTMQTEINNLK